MDKRYLRKDGAIVWVRLTVGCVRKSDRSIDYFVSVMEDISARKRVVSRSWLEFFGGAISGILKIADQAARSIG
jgi:PAS domain S-box-containing protein